MSKKLVRCVTEIGKQKGLNNSEIDGVTAIVGKIIFDNAQTLVIVFTKKEKGDFRWRKALVPS